MTHQEKIDFIRKACIAANPDILKLEFGCEIKFWEEISIIMHYEKGGSSFDGENTEYYSGKLYTYTNEGELRTHGDDGDFEMPRMSELEIIGRPIRLADVLLAVEKNNPPDSKYSAIEFWFSEEKENFGKLSFWHHTQEHPEDIIWWDLSKEFPDQDEPTLDFIISSLSKE